MKKENKVTILSTFAKDILVKETGEIISEQKGGPAFFLLKAFELESARKNC